LAYVFLGDEGAAQSRLTFAQLLDRAGRVAARLAGLAEPGERALVIIPAGLDFIVAFLGCLMARVIAVPLRVTRRGSGQGAGMRVLADCAPRIAITSARLAAGAGEDIRKRLDTPGLAWLVLDGFDEPHADVRLAGADPSPSDTAFLQYTSGSTADPKGVVVTHANLLENLEMIRGAFGNTKASTYASWLPLYHDMGLILNVLQSLYVGAHCILLSPASFIQRPLTWIRAIGEYRAEVAGAPNFAFDLCVERLRPAQMAGVDLSSWKVAFNGAEPVRADTIDRFCRAFAPYGFDPRAIYPCYGMAEATLLISGGQRGCGVRTRAVSRTALGAQKIARPQSNADVQTLVGCGRTLVGERVAIVDPVTRQRRAPCCIGEIWVDGPNVASGYWRAQDATRSVFGAVVAGEPDARWLRTGDLGFLDEDGELFVTGRIKDLIIVRGINHYPQDIENTVQGVHPALRKHSAAAFSVVGDDGQERLVIVQEVERSHRHRIDPDEITGLIREAVVNEHDIFIHEVVLIRVGTLPKTTSGKVQRALTRELWRRGAIEIAAKESV